MRSLPFRIVDVFAESALAGNPLAVFYDVGQLDTSTMQRLAREMNFSETTFVESRSIRDGGYDVRIFTPNEEVPFAGHPTLGTAFLIRQEVLRRPVDRVTLNLKCGPIAVDFEYRDDKVERLWMHQPSPDFGSEFEAAAVASALGLSPSEIETNVPVQDVSTGLPFILVPLKTRDAVRRTALHRERYFALIERARAKAILVFARDAHSHDNLAHVRVFADYYGTPEDPATGSANGALAAYFSRYRVFGSRSLEARVEQGAEMGRPSVLYLRAGDKEGTIAVSVGGKVQEVASGTFRLETNLDPGDIVR